MARSIASQPLCFAGRTVDLSVWHEREPARRWGRIPHLRPARTFSFRHSTEIVDGRTGRKVSTLSHRNPLSWLLVILVALTVAVPPLARADGLPSSTTVEIVFDPVKFPTNLAFAPDGRVFFTELWGSVKIIKDNQIQAHPFFSDPNVVTDAEAGFLGLALDREFATNHFVYIAYSYYLPGKIGDDNSVRNRLIRVRDDNGNGVDVTVLINDIPGAKNFANGGKLVMGPENVLYLSVGSLASVRDVPQDLSSLNGKILRVNRDGTIPSDNPIPDSYIYAYGFRNIYGMTFDPKNGALWVTDNGTYCDDKLILVQGGKNHGFSNANTCGNQVAGSVPPMFRWPQTIGATGIAFICGSTFPDLSDRIALGDTNLGAVMEVKLNADHSRVLGVDTLYSIPENNYIVEVMRAPDGSIYFTTQSAIYRIRPAGSASKSVPSLAHALDQNLFQIFVPAAYSAPPAC